MPGNSLSAVIDFLPDPIIVIDTQRVVLFANAAGIRVLAARAGLCIHRGVLAFAKADADEQLRRLVTSDAGSSAVRTTCRGLRVPRQSISKDWFVTVSRLPVGTFLVHLVGRIHPQRLPDAVLRDLFDLTPNEIAVLHRIVRHESTPAIARHLCRSHETIKAYLKRIFRKCDVSSRSDLIALLQRLSLFGNTPGRAAKKYPIGGIDSDRATGKLPARKNNDATPGDL